ncbi:MAG: dicarboxylate/amino acid:cation symporter [Gammaproteobacteria bacterium]|nr:dicarboxylate/amino acid:cation symporter [Gammaproteobacteria bacterium]NNL10144.1 dicarboxylate/amino acid:cation symporter [Pseudomonadales bacterium]RZV52170.1 MAG: dicarboxylate/amino acid:cation symporter [Pseudomonadales bacterium]
MTLTNKIFVAMTAGIAVGTISNMLMAGSSGALATAMDTYIFTGLFDLVGRVFIASLKVLVVPLVFVSLVCGTNSLGAQSRMGVLAGKTIALYLFTTALAISIALALAVFIEPGAGNTYQTESTYTATKPPPLKEVLVNIFPSNPIKAMAEGNMLQVIVFALLFGIALSRAGAVGERVTEFFRSLNEVIMEMVKILMELAPYGVFCLLAKIFFVTGFGLIAQLFLYFATVVLALLVHAGAVYSSLLFFFTRLNPLVFLKRIRPVMMFGFATASSNATMPITLETAEEKLGVNNSVASFTIPLGATINMDGTAIMQGVATVFIAQAYQVDIGVAGYLTVILTATLASIGAAGVPGVGLITLALVLQQVGLPVEGIALIVGVDRLLDMLRTAVNVTGDSTVTCIVAKSENALDEDVFYQRSTSRPGVSASSGA